MANQADAGAPRLPVQRPPLGQGAVHHPGHRAQRLHGRRQRTARRSGPVGPRPPPGRTGPSTPWPPSWPRSPSAAPPCCAAAGPDGLPVRDVVPTKDRERAGAVAEEDARPDRLDAGEGRATTPSRRTALLIGRGRAPGSNWRPRRSPSSRGSSSHGPSTRSGTSSRSWCTSWRTSGSATASPRAPGPTCGSTKDTPPGTRPSTPRRRPTGPWRRGCGPPTGASDTWRAAGGPPAAPKGAEPGEKLSIFRPNVYDGSALVLYALREEIGRPAFEQLERDLGEHPPGRGRGHRGLPRPRLGDRRPRPGRILRGLALRGEDPAHAGPPRLAQQAGEEAREAEKPREAHAR